MQNGLGMNETLEILELNRVHLTEYNVTLCCRALSFLRTNTALKSLVVNVQYGVSESRLSAFRTDIAAMLQENTSLESLDIRNAYAFEIKAEDVIAIVTALQHNSTLKVLHFTEYGRKLTADEDKQIAPLLKKNYGLECLPNVNHQGGDVGSILPLNGAGRRYLVQDGASVSKGVEVLSRVNKDINCVFLHLLENPRLCDRRAVKMVLPGGSTGLPTSSSGGKR
jgi:hypothetical protein